MNKLTYFLPLCAMFIFYKSTAQNYVIQETNIDPKNNLSSFVYTAKKCAAVMEKKSPMSSLAFASNSTLTNIFINALSDKYVVTFPPSTKPDYGPVIERPLANSKDKIIKLTYALFPADKKSTDRYVQLIVTFDKTSPTPKIYDIQVKNKAEVGIISITEREVLNLTKKPEPAAAKKSTPTVKKKAPVKKK